MKVSRRWRGRGDGVEADAIDARSIVVKVSGASMASVCTHHRHGDEVNRDAEKRTGRGPLRRRVRQLEGLLALQVLEPLDLQDLAGEDVDLSAQRVSGSGERDNGGGMASRYGAALLAMKFMYPW